MKTNAIIRIIIYSLLILILIGVMGGFIEDEIYLSGGTLRRSDTTVPTEAAMEINQLDFTTQIQNIEITWAAGSITIHPSDSLDHISVGEASIHRGTPGMVCRQSGQTLKIEFSEDYAKFPDFRIDGDDAKDLVIRVPKNWNCNNLEIDAAATDVNIQDLSINELDFDGASGMLILDNCYITDLDVDTASGYVQFMGTLENLDFDAASAKFSGEFYESPRSLKMDSMDGDLELVLPPDAGFTCNVNGLSSNFTSDFELANTGGTYVHGDGTCRIDVSALSGNVSILKGITTGKNCDH